LLKAHPSFNSKLTDIVVGGTAYPILTSDYQVKRQPTSERRSGALLGMPGWEQPSVQLPERWFRLAQQGKEVKVPSETLLEFRLQQPASCRPDR
jgi:hypothetical protein